MPADESAPAAPTDPEKETEPSAEGRPSLVQLADALEKAGIPAWLHGDRLLAVIRGHGDLGDVSSDALAGSNDVLGHAPSAALLCVCSAAALADALPKAVVTAAGAQRWSVATTDGPADLIPTGGRPVESLLLDFGLSVWSVAYRLADGAWADPMDQRNEIRAGRFAALPDRDERNAFELAPRRYWLTARLLAEHRLVPSDQLVEAARAALPDCLPRLPQGAPARRELARILMAPDAALGLRFLRSTGIADAFFAGNHPAAEEVVEAMPRDPALRWAAWLAGSATQAALRRWKMPHALGHEIEKLLRMHPLDRTTQALAEAGLRRLWQRLGASGFETLMRWRRLELDRTPISEETRRAEAQLDKLARRFSEFEARRAAASQVDALGLDGDEIMALLGCGPGRLVGEALRYLTEWKQRQPDPVDRATLEKVLRDWHAERIREAGTRSDASRREIG